MKIVTRSPAQEAAIDAAIAHLELIMMQRRTRIEIQVAIVDAAAIISAPSTTENTYTGMHRAMLEAAQRPKFDTSREDYNEHDHAAAFES